MTLVCVSGSRSLVDHPSIRHHMKETIKKLLLKFPDLKIMNGDAVGVDRISTAVCLELGIDVTRVPAAWTNEDETFDKAAGYKRNIKMIELIDRGLVFWDGVSKGTHHFIKECAKRDIPTDLVVLKVK